MFQWGIVSLLYCALFAGFAIREIRGVNRARAQAGRPAFCLREGLLRYRFLLRPTCALFVIYLFALSALLRANSFIIDDLVRASNGVGAWANFSRYTSSLLSRIIHADFYLADVAPLPQLLAALIMAFAGAVLIHLITGSTRISAWSIIGAIPLGLTPYFLSCFGYRYDAPYMAVSVLASILPLLLQRRSRGVYVLASGFGVFLTCTSYQASLGLFPMTVALVTLLRWNRGEGPRELLDFLLCSVAGYVVGVLSFRLFVMTPITLYASSEVPSPGSLLPTMIANYKRYFQDLLSDFKIEWLLMIALILIACLYVLVRDSKRKKPLALLASILILLAMALLSFGVYPILEKPLFQPRAMYGIGGLFACACIVVMSSVRMLPGKLVTIALCWAFFSFAFVYGNAEFQQREYADFRVSLVLEDLSELELREDGEDYSFQVSGSIGLSPVIRNMPQDYQMLNRLVGPLFYGNSPHGVLKFRYFGSDGYTWGGEGIPEEAYAMPVLKDTTYHTIRGDGERILIELK